MKLCIRLLGKATDHTNNQAKKETFKCTESERRSNLDLEELIGDIGSRMGVKASGATGEGAVADCARGRDMGVGVPSSSSGVPSA